MQLYNVKLFSFIHCFATMFLLEISTDYRPCLSLSEQWDSKELLANFIARFGICRN